MQRGEPFAVGSEIVWRSRPSGEVGYVFGCHVLLDEPDVAAVVQPTGAPVVRRIAQRGGPNARSLLPGTWDGARRTTSWDRPPCVRLHPVGRNYSVIRRWIPQRQCFEGWYVNLEQPWTRTLVGFDSRDDVLDITVSDDLTGWQLKDADELAFAVEVGLFTSDEAQIVDSAAERAVEDLVHRRRPFDDGSWDRVLPSHLLEPTDLPDGWDNY